MKNITFLLLIICLSLAACRPEEIPAGEAFLSDFHVQSPYRNKPIYTEEDQEARWKMLRTYYSDISEVLEDGEDYYLSQPYPILNGREKHRVFNCFLFHENKYIGLLTFGDPKGMFVGTVGINIPPLGLPVECPELTEWLQDGTEFVLITDGMRLWLVSEQEAYVSPNSALWMLRGRK